MSKFNIGDKVVIIKNLSDSSLLKIGTIGTVINLDNKSRKYPILVKDEKGIEDVFNEEELELLSKVNLLQFKEVICTIKPNDVWQYNNLEIMLDRSDNFITIRDKNTNSNITIDKNTKFEKIKNKFLFEEAYIAFKAGKEIQSSIGTKYKIIDNKKCFWSTYSEGWENIFDGSLSFSIDEIDGYWFIND